MWKESRGSHSHIQYVNTGKRHFCLWFWKAQSKSGCSWLNFVSDCPVLLSVQRKAVFCSPPLGTTPKCLPELRAGLRPLWLLGYLSCKEHPWRVTNTHLWLCYSAMSGIQPSSNELWLLPALCWKASRWSGCWCRQTGWFGLEVSMYKPKSHSVCLRLVTSRGGVTTSCA